MIFSVQAPLLVVAMFFAASRLSMADDDKPLSPREAKTFEGKVATVAVTPQTIGKRKRGTEHHFFLVNAKSPKNFAPEILYVTIPVEAAKAFGEEDLDKLQDALFMKYHGKNLSVQGKVRIEKDEDGDLSRVRIDVTDPKQITILNQ